MRWIIALLTVAIWLGSVGTMAALIPCGDRGGEKSGAGACVGISIRFPVKPPANGRALNRRCALHLIRVDVPGEVRAVSVACVDFYFRFPAPSRIFPAVSRLGRRIKIRGRHQRGGQATVGSAGPRGRARSGVARPPNDDVRRCCKFARAISEVCSRTITSATRVTGRVSPPRLPGPPEPHTIIAS